MRGASGSIGGLVLMNGGPVEPFLGSSINSINKARIIDGDVMTENILVRENADVTRTARLLRQYYKRDSFKQWSLLFAPSKITTMCTILFLDVCLLSASKYQL